VKDTNTCPHCRQRNRIEDSICNNCNQQIVLPAEGAITIWRLGTVREGLIGILARVLQDAFHLPCAIQPAFMAERPSLCPDWNGISANVFLKQTLARHRKKEAAVLGITEKNIVPSASYNFLFGNAYLGLPAATASIHPLADDKPPVCQRRANTCRIPCSGNASSSSQESLRKSSPLAAESPHSWEVLLTPRNSFLR